MLLVGQYYPQLQALAAEYHAKGLSLNSPGGPGSVLCSFPGANQSYGYLFFIEFFADVFVVCSAVNLNASGSLLNCSRES